MVAALQLNPKLLDVYFQHLWNATRREDQWRRGQDHMVTTEIKRGKTADQFSAARCMIQQSVETFRCHSAFHMGTRQNEESRWHMLCKCRRFTAARPEISHGCKWYTRPNSRGTGSNGNSTQRSNCLHGTTVYYIIGGSKLFWPESQMIRNQKLSRRLPHFRQRPVTLDACTPAEHCLRSDWSIYRFCHFSCVFALHCAVVNFSWFFLCQPP